jgi:hypothetical protein
LSLRNAVKYQFMSEETSPLIAMRLAGHAMVPGAIRSHDLAELIDSFEEMIACVVADRHLNIKKDDVVIGLASLGDGSIRLGFKSVVPSVVIPAYLSVASAVNKNEFTSLPSSSRRALDKIISFTRRHHCVAELHSPDNDELIASITPSTNTQVSGLAQGLTTIYGRILRVGGKNPRVTVETVSGDSIYCDVSFEIAQELGRRLYEFAEFSGMATWNPNGWQIEEFRIESFASSATKTPEQGMNELRSLVGRYFEDIDDVDSYISSLRSASVVVIVFEPSVAVSQVIRCSTA